MAQRDVLAGAGGVLLGAARTDHAGRRAVLVVRGEEDTTEFTDLAKTMGIDLVDVVKQRGREDPRTYLGRGRLDEVGDVLRSAPHGHVWYGVDLVLMHTNATPRQLVATSTVLGVEVWDRVRLLLALFTAHAASVEARTQVRIARLRSDRTVLRELISQETTGERAGYGGAGATGATEVLVTLGREIEGLRKRLQRHARAQSERRRQRTRSGARTVGLAGYTNAGKSSLFRALSGKSVLVEDRLFSTLETTVGRMEASPRVLLADTIGFIDALPSETLEAFRATLAEALECDLLLLMADASDDGDELLRRLNTSIREVQDRLDEDDVEVMVVLTKIDLIDAQQRKTVEDLVADIGLFNPHFVSAHTGEGMVALRDAILTHLHGPARVLRIAAPDEGGRPIAALEDAVRNAGLVLERRTSDDAVDLLLWCDGADLQRLMAQAPNRFSVIGEGVEAFRS
ncbi:MAG: GTPase HflX [Candidatus Thermoplasmatota archaeon]|nr:GTPase HflX [Candidatus Thermoplasmatota archaeon]